MAKLFFRYGAMGSSKTANALMVKYNYEERGKKALLVKPQLDIRDGKDIIKSRIGLQCTCISMEHFMSDFYNYEIIVTDYDCIIVDEAQFLTTEQVDFLSYMVDDWNIPVICYGLRTDFQNKLFEGSKRLFELADVIEEIITICWCGKKATCNARYNETGIVKDGDQIVLGANDSYIALCRKHYKQNMLHE